MIDAKVGSKQLKNRSSLASIMAGACDKIARNLSFVALFTISDAYILLDFRRFLPENCTEKDQISTRMPTTNQNLLSLSRHLRLFSLFDQPQRSLVSFTVSLITFAAFAVSFVCD